MKLSLELPKGELELLVDGKWTSVAFTDWPDDYMDDVKIWSEKHTVTAARYNSHRYKNEVPVILWQA